MMEGNLDLSSRTTMPSNVSFVGFDLQLQDPIGLHHHHQQQQQLLASHQNLRQASSPMVSTVPKNFPLTIGSTTTQSHDLLHSLPKSTSDEDEPSFADDGNDSRKGKKACSPWQRVKWTDEMVRLLITAVSYINEEASAENNTTTTSTCSRRKHANLQKGKWKSVSKVLAERGFYVSPQQCEDKFNDLNKRYKRLNEILGRGTSCEVVENPSLLEVVDHVSGKAKDEVRKILSSKHLHYEEMCSYHNGNRLHLPPDPDLQRSLHSARDDGEEHESRSHHPHEENGNENDHELDQDTECDEDSGEQNPSKRARALQGNTTVFSLDCNDEANHAPGEETESKSMLKKQWFSHRSLQLEEQRLQIETQMLELEKERFKWQRFCRKKDRELDVAKMEIERMKLENERMALELRKAEMEFNSSSC